MEEELDPCGVPNSGGLAALIGVSVGGTRLGTVAYLHLASVEVPVGEIPNGAELGDMVAAPPAKSTRPVPGGLAAPLFDFVVPADGQRHEVCARGVNVGHGIDVTLGNCIAVT